MAIRSISFITLGILMTWQASIALVLRTYNASDHDRFTGFSNAPIHNLSFIHAAYNLTGVGWHTGNTARQLTMVSPIHFVGANHYRPGIGATIRFVASDGSIKNYTVASQVAITNDDGDASDLFYGTLSNPIAETDLVNYFPYLNLSNERNYRRRDLIILGKTARSGSGELSTTVDISSSSTNSTRCLRWNCSTLLGSNDDAYLQSGDSGSPVFIDQGGTAAIVGTNSLVSTGTSTIYNYASFIPYYADKLDTAMANLGYHMTRAIPGSTTLSLTHTPPSTIVRSGHPFTINLSLENTQNIRADNVKLHNSFPAGTTVSIAGGSDWFDESTPSFTKARRAFIAGSSSTDYSLTLTIPEAGTAQHGVTFSCDQFSASTQNFNIDVIGSFLSFTSGLIDASATGDDDLDGIINLLEYVFGGDPAASSQFLPNTTVPLLPEFTQVGSVFQISYLRRKDYLVRAIGYDLESTTTMAAATWGDATSLITNTTVDSVNTEFEKVTHELSGAANVRFFRVEVSVNE